MAFASSGLMRRDCVAGAGAAKAGCAGLTAADAARRPPAVAVSAERRDTSCSCMPLVCAHSSRSWDTATGATRPRPGCSVYNGLATQQISVDNVRWQIAAGLTNLQPSGPPWVTTAHQCSVGPSTPCTFTACSYRCSMFAWPRAV